MKFFRHHQKRARRSARIERRLAAYHEAGHRTIAELFGALADCIIYPNPDRFDDEDQLPWTGHCDVWTMPGTSNDWLPKMGMAGNLAEYIAIGIDLDWVFELFTFDYYNGGFSESDREGLETCTREDVVDTLHHLLERWSLVEAYVYEMLSEPDPLSPQD